MPKCSLTNLPKKDVTWQRLWPILLTFIIVSTIAIFDIYYFQKISASRVFTVEAEDFCF